MSECCLAVVDTYCVSSAATPVRFTLQLCSADPAKRQQSEWAKLPYQVLKDSFELQSDPLNNCAAACTCKKWQTVANDSYIPSLHLHTDSAAHTQHLTAFLAARSSIGQLVITAESSSSTSRHISGAVKHSLLSSIPLSCKSLSVDELFADEVQHYTDMAVRLQHLTLDLDKVARAKGPLFDPLSAAPNLCHLSELRSLKLATSSEYKGSSAFAKCLAKCPSSLEALSIHGLTPGPLMIDFLPEASQSLDTQLTQLTQLELVHCRVSIPEGAVTCLERLVDLSLNKSDLFCHNELSKLTKLTSLDLTGCRWDTLDRGNFLSKFEACSALQVLKIVNCSQITTGTFLAIPTVSHVYTDFLHFDMANAQIHLELQMFEGVFDTHVNLLSPDWCDHLVDIQLRVNPVRSDRYSASYMAGFVMDFFRQCPALQNLDLSCVASRDNGDCCIIVLRGAATMLKTFKLRGIRCKEMDLHRALSLTSIRLSDIDSKHKSCKLVLPKGLERLEFFGSTLFTPNKYSLEGFDSLKHIVLGSRQPGRGFDEKLDSLSSSARMPRLPSSLRHLHMTCVCTERLLNANAWQSLQFCANLEHLTVPDGHWEGLV